MKIYRKLLSESERGVFTHEIIVQTVINGTDYSTSNMKCSPQTVREKYKLGCSTIEKFVQNDSRHN